MDDLNFFRVSSGLQHDPACSRLHGFIRTYISDLFAPSVIIFHFEGMSFSSAHDLKQWDFLDNNEIFSEFAQFIRQHILTILTIKQLVVKRPSLTRCAQT